jgi:hypothetical protein
LDIANRSTIENKVESKSEKKHSVAFDETISEEKKNKKNHTNNEDEINTKNILSRKDNNNTKNEKCFNCEKQILRTAELFKSFPCQCNFFCKKCAMKMATGGRCKSCKNFFASMKSFS